MRCVPLFLSLALGVVACDSDSGATDTDAATAPGVSDDGTGSGMGSTSAGGAGPTMGTTTGVSTADPVTTGETTSAPATSGEPTTGEATTDVAEETGAGETTGGLVPQLPPGDVDSLIAWLQDGGYEDWAAESAVHDSDGPHFGNVRTFFNNVLVGSFDASDDVHPIGSANVKELYGPGNTVRGWAVMYKREVDDGQWYWFEVYDGDVLADTVAWDLCEDCHGDGVDNVLTPWPLQ
ncbi:MAG: hypothetical protein ACE37F_14800 [Nannocystaceae bacterium]|nr:hypothetical protein [bacterium]